MRNWICGLAVAVCVGLTGCSLSPSQRYGVAAVAYTASVNTITANSDQLSDDDLRRIKPAVDTGKAYLDDTYELLTDGDPTNDTSVEPLLDALEGYVLSTLEQAAQEAD